MRPKFCHPEAVFWDIDFKLSIKKQKTQKKPLTLPPFLLKRF